MSGVLPKPAGASRSVYALGKADSVVFTPKGLYLLAQGRERTLGTRTAQYNRVSSHGPTRNGSIDVPPVPQGALAALATLGCDV